MNGDARLSVNVPHVAKTLYPYITSGTTMRAKLQQGLSGDAG